MQRIGNTSRKFSGGGKYYHRHAEGRNDARAAIDWQEHQRRLGRQRLLRVLCMLAVVLFICSVIVGAVFLVSQ